MRTPRWLERLWDLIDGDKTTFCGPTPEDEARWAVLEHYENLRRSMNMLGAMRLEENARVAHAARVARIVDGREKYGLTWDGRIKCPE